MAQFAKRAFQLTPNQLLYQQKRYRGKINLKKPKIFYNKAVVNKLIKPYIEHPNKGKPLEELCLNTKINVGNAELGPYEKIISREIRNWFDNSRMVACLHVNSMSELDKFEVKVPLHRSNMYYKQYGPKIVLDAIKDSPYEGITPLINRYTAFVFSPEIQVDALEKIIRKCKRMYTLGGILEKQLFNYNDFMKYGKMNIVSAQLGLIQILQNAGGVNLNRQLTHHQTTLVTRLKQIGTNEATSNENDKSVPV